jgi:NTE family protein
MRKIRVLPTLIWVTLVVSVGCSHYPINRSLTESSPTLPYVFNDQATGSNTNELFVCLAFSGGGTRAAALSYGVLERLRDIRIVWKGEEKSLLEEVDCISSVSGGSFTSAYYGLFRNRIFQDFREKFLEKDVQEALLSRVLLPSNWFRLASPYFSRIDLAAEYYDENIFEGRTFKSLAEGGQRPFVIINATNMATGERFEFTQQEFNILGSDLNSYSVARSVAASSAFPLLLSPVSLKNYEAPESTKIIKEMRLAQDDFYNNRRRYQWAVNRLRYKDVPEYPYIHLMDGGLADNIGLRPIEAAYRRSSGFIRRLINDGKIEKLVIIIVNAKTEGQDKISKEEKPPGEVTAAVKTATVALDNYSFESIEIIKGLREERVRAQNIIDSCQEKIEKCPEAGKLPRFASKIEPYIIDIDFEALEDPVRRSYFLGLPKSFKLTQEQVEKLIKVGSELLDADPEFKDLMRALGK